MSNHDHSQHQESKRGSLLASRVGLVLLGFLAIAGLLLVYEHRAHIFVGNWFWIVLLVLCVGMHHFMHGGHSGHGGHGGGNEGDRKSSGERR